MEKIKAAIHSFNSPVSSSSVFSVIGMPSALSDSIRLSRYCSCPTGVKTVIFPAFASSVWRKPMPSAASIIQLI